MVGSKFIMQAEVTAGDSSVCGLQNEGSQVEQETAN
jgi:hypothetical protein